MFNRGRGRPLLAAAVVMGASKSAAKSEVAKQEQLNFQRQQAADREALEKQREKEETERHTQQVIHEEIERERSRTAQIEADRQYATISNAGGPGETYHPPSHPNYGPRAPERKKAEGHYCSECGNFCMFGDKFCSKCGFKQPAVELLGNLP
ncbi:hypothetical protein DL95DRAFT_334818 [Leptodontidium sp. 2 PMI_412]|nr:hypothetical protein BKA61DRAFT_616772 [Leptodontidium sp. MPI-SDFR-AT-0119]KAH9216725.1 hypothetical protein DL95DRAFT_334818 [Leptodontidium sp. 2 PMI_412]